MNEESGITKRVGRTCNAKSQRAASRSDGHRTGEQAVARAGLVSLDEMLGKTLSAQRAVPNGTVSKR